MTVQATNSSNNNGDNNYDEEIINQILLIDTHFRNFDKSNVSNF